MIQCVKVSLADILPLRTLFLQENNFQIRYDACHVRGWSDSYLLSVNAQQVGYGSVKGKEELSDRDAIFEFYVLADYRKIVNTLFAALISVSKASFIECQSNDFLLSSMQYEFGKNIYSDVILFKDHTQTQYQFPEVIFRKRQEGDDVFGKKAADAGAYVLEKDGLILADGGFLLHYNMPFADLYMETNPDYRQMGYGSYILQEVKKACYLSGRVPAARCNITNMASKATLLKAGFAVAGYMLTGEIR